MVEDRMVSQAVTKSLALLHGDTLIYSRLSNKKVIMWSMEHKSEMSQEQFIQKYTYCKKKVGNLLLKMISGDRRSSKVRQQQKEACEEIDRITGGKFFKSCPSP